MKPRAVTGPIPAVLHESIGAPQYWIGKEGGDQPLSTPFVDPVRVGFQGLFQHLSSRVLQYPALGGLFLLPGQIVGTPAPPRPVETDVPEDLPGTETFLPTKGSSLLDQPFEDCGWAGDRVGSEVK
jgi:hypothetical protein